jgi:single-strand DNA-binding protein
MSQFQQVIGFIGRSAELRYVPQGTAVADFSVAANSGYGDKKTTAWFKVTVWGKLAESLSPYLLKGKQVCVRGELQVDSETGGPRVWTDNNGNARASFEMTAREIELLGGGKESAEEESQDEIPW